MHKIDFTVKLTGSKLFDMYSYATAQKICAKFPGLSFTYDDKEIRIQGELNDYWFEKYQTAVFELGNLD